MPRSTTLLIVLATLSVSAPAFLAQTTNPAGPENLNYMQAQAAPIERGTPVQNYAEPIRPARRAASVANAQPAQGVLVRYQSGNSVETVTADTTRTELRITHGIVNIDVRNPEPNTLLLIDMPGGQTQLLKNGLYTFNADTNTVRVLHGEADAFPGATPADKPIKVKEDHQVAFVGTHIHATDFDQYQATADLLPSLNGEPNSPRHDDGYGYGVYPYPYPYGGFYGDPYWGYGYPFGWGLGYGWGGWGYGGFYGGGFRGGGFGGGFHGGGRR